MNTCCEGQGTRALGSMPEYIFSIDSSRRTASPSSAAKGFYVNLYANATLLFNASVACGGPGEIPPPPPTLPPLPALPPPHAAVPPLRYNLLLNGSYYSSRTAMTGNAASLQQCQAVCSSTKHPNFCMGFSWVGNDNPTPPAPSPPKQCDSNCTLVEIGNGLFHEGEYNQSQTSKVTSLDACKTACLEDEACVQLTWAERPVDPCVLYQQIYSTWWPKNPSVEGWVKCATGETNASTCARISPPPPSPSRGCLLYDAIDTTVPPVRMANIVQYVADGRQQAVQYDWISSDSAENLKQDKEHQSVDNGTVEVRFQIVSDFPFDNKVKMIVDWVTPNIDTVAMAVNLRMPSWMDRTIAVFRNGNNWKIGTPGTYLTLDGDWQKNDIISFDLPHVISLSPYTGWDQLPGYENKRYALKVGPIVMACVGKMDSNFSIVLPVPPSNLNQWLQTTADSLRFEVAGAPGYTFMPLWEMSASDSFTIYPVLAG